MYLLKANRHIQTHKHTQTLNTKDTRIHIHSFFLSLTHTLPNLLKFKWFFFQMEKLISVSQTVEHSSTIISDILSRILNETVMREETICRICFNLLNDIDYHLKEAQEKTGATISWSLFRLENQKLKATSDNLLEMVDFFKTISEFLTLWTMNNLLKSSTHSYADAFPDHCFLVW